MTLITISTHNGSQAHRGHNIRDERAIKNQDHIDRNGNFEIWRDEKPRDAYERIFGQAVKDYNEKQTRADRKIENYYNKIHESKQQHTVYEMIVQVGSRKNPISPEESREIIKEYYDSWNDRNPNLELIGAYYHADEKGEPHLHADYIPVASYEKGLAVRTGLNKALEAQGFEKRGKITPQIQWERSENDYLERLCRDRGHTVEHPERDKSPDAKREHEETQIYQAKMDLEQEREKLQQEKEKVKEQQEKQFNKAIEQDRTARALDRKEKDLAEGREKLKTDIKTVATERDKVNAVKEQIRADRDVLSQIRETADRVQNIRTERMEMPAPAGTGFHKGYYTVEQVRALTNEVNKAREATRNVEKYREVSSLDERMEQASRQANQNIKEKALERLQEENRQLQKDRDFVNWLEKNYDVKDIKKEYEKAKEQEREHTRSRGHDRNSPDR